MLAHFHKMPIQVGQAVKGDMLLFQACTHLGISHPPQVQVITDAYVKKAVVELCFEKKTKESVAETFKKCFAGFCL